MIVIILCYNILSKYTLILILMNIQVEIRAILNLLFHSLFLSDYYVLKFLSFLPQYRIYMYIIFYFFFF